MNKDYIFIDKEGLLFLLTQMYIDINAKSEVTISTEINSSSTNDTAAGSKAVYDYVVSAVANIERFSAVIVSVLPESGEINKMYLVPKTAGTPDDGYDEYLFIDSKWEKVGTTNIDLTGYLKKEPYGNTALSVLKNWH